MTVLSPQTEIEKSQSKKVMYLKMKISLEVM